MGRTAHLGPFATPVARATARSRAQRSTTLGIAHLADADYTRISGGERQLALIARALAQEPRMLVMDEPTASLDFGNQVRVLDRIRARRATGIGVVLSTHDPDQAFLCATASRCCTRAASLDCAPPERGDHPAEASSRSTASTSP